MRIAGCVEYCGKNYKGWQYQHHAPSVQQALEQAFSRVANHEVAIVAAGRTDAGVHGIGQIFHFDTESERSDYGWVRGVNSWLPDDISVTWTQQVCNDFHARFKATARSYRYIIFNRSVSPSFLSGLVTWHRNKLDVERMQQATQFLVGCHNFEAYRAVACQSKNPCKEIYQLEIGQKQEWIWFDVRADGFLHHMVRNIVGVFMKIGEGERDPTWAHDVLRSQDRRKGGITAPADGLYLCSIEYDPCYELPAAPDKCRFW